jgi:hypothetical protein
MKPARWKTKNRGKLKEPDTQRETGKPLETPSLFKNVLLPFLNRLSYVQFVSGAPIFQGLTLLNGTTDSATVLAHLSITT